MWKRARQTGAGTAARAPRRRRSGAALALAAHGGNAAVARRLGLRVLQRKKIVNLASGTRPETLMRPPTAEDEVINVDSGHMVVAEILRDRPTAYFEQAAGELGIKREALAARAQKSASATWYGRAERETQELGMGPLAIGLMSAAVKREAYEKELRDFVVRALFERYPGRAGLERLSREVLTAEEIKEFRGRIDKLQAGSSKGFRFAHGFVESLPEVAGKEDVDEVHVISALGFDLINDPAAIESVWCVLKKGGKLIVTSERTGMAAKAVKAKGHDPVLDEHGKPVLKPDIALLKRFTYLPAESAYGKGIFKAAYPAMQTQHTSGEDAFAADVPFARLVFLKH